MENKVQQRLPPRNNIDIRKQLQGVQNNWLGAPIRRTHGIDPRSSIRQLVHLLWEDPWVGASNKIGSALVVDSASADATHRKTKGAIADQQAAAADHRVEPVEDAVDPWRKEGSNKNSATVEQSVQAPEEDLGNHGCHRTKLRENGRRAVADENDTTSKYSNHKSRRLYCHQRMKNISRSTSVNCPCSSKHLSGKLSRAFRRHRSLERSSNKSKNFIFPLLRDEAGFEVGRDVEEPSRTLN